MPLEQVAQIDPEQLVAVQREDGAALAPQGRCEAKPAASAQRLRLSDGGDLGTDPAELAHERRLVPLRARDDHAGDARFGEPRHLIRGEGPAGDGNERLRAALRGVAEALGLAARQDQGFHGCFIR